MSIRFAGIQHDIQWERPEDNFAHLAPLIAGAADEGAELVALTEMYSNGFSMNTLEIAEPIGGPSTEFLVTQAQRHGVWICGSVPEREAGRTLPRNTLVLSGPDGSIHRYSKLHRFAYAGEDQHYDGGDAPLTVTVKDVRISFFVCFDLRFAPDFWTLAPDTDFYLLVANWPAPRAEHWTTLLRARAIENLAYVAGINRVGAAGDGLAHTGDSRVFDPFGELIAADTPGTECILTATIDPIRVASIRTDFPFLGERTD